VPFSRITLTDIRIDVHAHYWTDAYLDMLVELGRCDTATQRGIGAGSGSELDLRRRLMDRAGVDIQVLSAAPQLPYSEENADGADAAARYVNDECAALVSLHPDRSAHSRPRRCPTSMLQLPKCPGPLTNWARSA
jgi:aminocarboxymuconate-semialdehyde decarboxylase